MIHEADAATKKKLFQLFAGMTDTSILSCLQGHMGKAWVDDALQPTAAQIVVGDFVFFAGDTSGEAVKELLRNLPRQCLVITENNAWDRLLERVHQSAAKKIQRFTFRKNIGDLDKKHLQYLLKNLPNGYVVKKINLDIAAMPSLQMISFDFTGQFESLEDYARRGIGYCMMHRGEVVCAASSYSIYDNGIEIEIGTDSRHRRKGLAAIAGAALILDCLEHDKYPSWDAANPASARLAERLGYVPAGVYDAYEVRMD